MTNRLIGGIVFLLVFLTANVVRGDEAERQGSAGH